MYYDNKDKRTPLSNNSVVVINDTAAGSRREYVIDSLAGTGGFALMYIAHEKNDMHHYVALKELFPRALDDAVAERREDGKIVIYDPMTESDECNDESVWDKITPYFDREVKLTRKAAAVYDSYGRQAAQNSPDVLGISGPFIAENGNQYIVIDTKKGKSLRQFIDNGWESNSDKGVYRNNLLDEIFDILLKTTQRLTFMHGDNRMYHLDLSPANIYISYINGGTSVEPTIIDYGSAYDCTDPEDLTSHRFTCNPFSAPEINALAELNNQNSGYYVDVTSDTYSIAAILFYAVLGELYTTQKIYDPSWRDKIQKLYPETIYDSFAEKLIEFFSRGLSADQSERYVTIQHSVTKKQDDLYSELTELKKLYKSADILNLCAIDQKDADELMSYIILDKYPLYKHYAKDGNIHVLCLGSGIFVQRMILSIISTGQMIGHRLYIHVVSENAESYKNSLLNEFPLLKKYADMGGNTVSDENKFVTFTFQNVPDLTKEEAYRKTAEDYGGMCRYVIISLGSNNKNITLARNFAAELGKVSKEKTLINYYMEEDSAQNSRADADSSIVPDHIELIPFGKLLASYNKDVHKLGMKAFRTSWLYTKIYNPHASRNAALREFIADEYGQRSSVASAVHIDYKLASLGINPTDPKITHKSIASYQSKIIESYTRMLKDPVKYGQLLQLEHMRWMFFMIADGYRLPTQRDLEKYSFKMVNGNFNKAFKCTDDKVKTHHCLVPCSDKGIQLPRDHREWDKYSSIEEIQNTDFDELDKASLTVHFIAKQRIERPSTRGKIESIIDNDLHNMLYLAPEDKDKADALKQEYDSFRNWISNVLEHKSPDKLKEKLEHLSEQFALCDIDISDITTQLSNELAIFEEFRAYKDYKAPDKAIIEHLLWIKFSDDLIMLKGAAGSVLSNITAPLIIEPQKLVYIGMEPDKQITEFFDKHGSNTDIFFEPCSFGSLEEVSSLLNRLTKSSVGGNYVIDVTDTNPFFVAAAVMLSEKNKKVGVICCGTKDFSITNIMNYPCASVYRLTSSLTASEVFGLYGAEEKPNIDNYMLRLREYMDALWKFYQAHSSDWEMISTFFAAFGRGSAEVRLKNIAIGSAKWNTYKKQVSPKAYSASGMPDVMEKLEKEGIIKNFNIQETEAFYNLTFDYPLVSGDRSSDLFAARFDALLKSLGNVTLSCDIVTNPKDKTKDIEISSNMKVSYYFTSDTFTNITRDKKFSLTAMEEPLKELKGMQLISFLEIKNDRGNYSISFTYNNSAIRDCLTTAGNILEAYVWYQADKTGYFDSLQTNFSFTWHNSRVSNELDVILTHGLTTLVCSCKTAKFNKEHLYEVADLANRFSVNTKPVIIYSSDKAYDDGKITSSTTAIRERAKEMGIYLIDKDMLNDNLGKELIRIAKEVC